MKLINPSWEIFEQEFPVRKLDMDVYHHHNALIDAMYRHIERCGRICYKSEDKITSTSAKPFVNSLIERQHLAMLEHGTVYLKVPKDKVEKVFIEEYQNNPYSKACYSCEDSCWYITTNYRVIVENQWLSDLAFMCCPTDKHEKRYCVHLVTNIQVYKDLTRHRSASFAIESTRFCNYSKGKFSNELTFIQPCWLKDKSKEEKLLYLSTLNNIEKAYLSLVEGKCAVFIDDLQNNESQSKVREFEKWQAQQAANLLPQATKADVIITSFASHWKHIFNLRTSTIAATGQPHPQVSELMNPVYEEFLNRKYL